MTAANEKYFKNREEWHKWLLANHQKEDEIWLVYYKKATGKPTISYEEAVMEALTFGWIDSTVNRIDDEKYKQRFTKRRKGSVWSETNLKRVQQLVKEGRMEKAGVAAAKDVLSGRVGVEKGTFPEAEMPKEFEKELKKDKTAWENFGKFPPSIKKAFYFWLTSAKQEETIKRRLVKAIKAAKENNKFGYM